MATIEYDKAGKAIQRCQYFIESKQRNCKLTRKAAEKYCPQHTQENNNGRIRVKCPYSNGAHTVWQDQMESHLKNCQQRPTVHEEKFYALNLNVVAYNAGEKLEGRDAQPPQSLNFDKWIPIIEQAYTSTLPVERDIKNHKGVEERLMEVENTKHAAQQASLIGHMDALGLIDTKFIVSEFGCGRSELSRYICRAQALNLQAGSKRKYLMVDRTSPRRKFDGKMIDDAEDRAEPLPVIKRIRVDIKDLNLPIALEPLLSGNGQHEKTTIVSKHLCGCATDLTLECIRNARNKVHGAAIALCCRQLCTWETFPLIGRKFLAENGIDGPEAFQCLTRLTSWAVGGVGRGEVDPKTVERRMDIGQRARRVVDHARLLAVQDMGFQQSKLVEYVDQSISVENVCLLLS